MPGVRKIHRRRESGRAFPSSRYDDPRGGRSSALERNVLRYRAAEATLYLFYAEEVRDFMLANVYRAAANPPSGDDPWRPSKEERLRGVHFNLVMEAESKNRLTPEDAQALRLMFDNDGNKGKKLRVAFGYAVKIGMFNEIEAGELKGLLDYRNDIAHRIHLVMSDVTRSYWTSDHVSFTAPTYKGDALDRLREYRNSLWERTRGRHLLLTLSMDRTLFEMAEQVFEGELRRLDGLIQRQIVREQRQWAAINAELDLSGTELVGDLSPRFPANHRPGYSYGDDYEPPSGHLTKRGVEICYRLFDLGKSPMAVAYLMGMTLRSAERRKQGWTKAGGSKRARVELDRYDLRSLRRMSSAKDS